MSLKEAIGRGTKRTFRPASAEGQLARATGMDARSRHTPTSQLFTHFEKPAHGFSLKQVIGTSPMDRQKFAREMVSYRQQVAEQRQLEAEQKKLAEQLGDAYRETVRYQARQIKSIEDLGQEKQRLQDIYKDTKQAYDQLQVELKRQQAAERVMKQTTSSLSRPSSSGRALAPGETIQRTTGQIMSGGRVVASPATPTQSQLSAMQRQLPTRRVLSGARLQFVRK